MKPSDALQQDWRLYYDQAWMEHRVMGPGLVRVINDRLYFYRFPDDEMEMEGMKVRAADLSCWWPRSGSYNAPGGAVYIARRTTRSMRKSAHPNEHYTVKWGKHQYGAYKLMLQLRTGPAIVDVDFAIQAMNAGITKSAAIADDIILAKRDKGLDVIYRGLKAGVLNGMNFLPDHPKAPLSRRVSARLTEEGLI